MVNNQEQISTGNGNFKEYKPQTILPPDRIKSFKCDKWHYITIESYDTKRTIKINSLEDDKIPETTQNIIETNYKIFIRKKDSAKAIGRTENPDTAPATH